MAHPVRILLLTLAMAVLVQVLVLPGPAESTSRQATPDASPVAGCDGLAPYLHEVDDALGPIRADLGDPVTYGDPKATPMPERTAAEWRSLSDRLRAAHAAWTGIAPPTWAAGWHAAVGEYLRLAADAGLAAATRGFYATAVYLGPLADARVEIAAALARAQAACPEFGDPLASEATPVAR